MLAQGVGGSSTRLKQKLSLYMDTQKHSAESITQSHKLSYSKPIQTTLSLGVMKAIDLYFKVNLLVNSKITLVYKFSIF